MGKRATILTTSCLMVGALAVLSASTASAGVSSNLLGNPGAESGVVAPWINFSSGWTPSSLSPMAGSYSFVPTVMADNVQMYQVISLAEFATDIAAGTAIAEFGGSGSTGGAAITEGMFCSVTLSLGFRTAANDPTASQIDLVIASGATTSGQNTVVVPANTDHVDVWVTGRNLDPPDSQLPGCLLKADDLYLRVNGPSIAGLPPTGPASYSDNMVVVSAGLVLIGIAGLAVARRSRRRVTA